MSDILQAFFAASHRRYDTVAVPLVGPVRIQSLTAGEMRTLRESFFDERGEVNERGRYRAHLLVAACIVDDKGSRVFSDEDAMRTFDVMDGGAFQVLYNRCASHTNFSADPDWQAVETAAKNSGATGSSS